MLYFNTLSEPTAKTLRYLSQFSFFDAKKLDAAMQFVDLGVILRDEGARATRSGSSWSTSRGSSRRIVVIDSFKVFDDLAASQRGAPQVRLRDRGQPDGLGDDRASLSASTRPNDIKTNPLFSIVDGLFLVTQREQSGEQQRFFQIVKMRGTDHSRDEHPFVITRERASRCSRRA